MAFDYYNYHQGNTKPGLLGGGNPGYGSWGDALSGIGNGLFNIFGAQDPSQAANPYLSGIEGGMGKYMNPYINGGLSMLPGLQDQYSQLMSNPGAVMNRIGSGFQQSPGYQWQVNQGLDATNRAAAAGGMLGSPMQQQNAATTVNQLANQDYGNYMNRALGMYGQGLGGASHLFDTGFNASNTMSNGLLQQLMAQAMSAYSGAANSNQSIGGGIGSVLGGIGSMAGLGGFL